MKNIIKKTVTLICALLFICSALGVSAAKLSWSPIMKVDTVTAACGDTVYVNAVLEESAEGIMASTFSLLYDNTALSYVGFTKGIFYDKPEVVDHGDYISIVMCDNTTNFKLGNIITIEFKVKEDAAGGFYPIKMANVRPKEKGESLKGCFANWRGDTITPIVTNGGVNIPITEGNCKHSFDEWVIKVEPTCDSKGLKNRVCPTCGKNQNEDIPETEHEYNDFWTIDRQATATEEGVMSRHCKNCDSKKDYVTFGLDISDNNDFKNEENETLDEKDWSDLEDYKTDDKDNNQSTPVQKPEDGNTQPEPEDPVIDTQIPDSAEDLINRGDADEEKLGISGKIYRYLYGEDGNGGIFGVIAKAFKIYISKIITI